MKCYPLSRLLNGPSLRLLFSSQRELQYRYKGLSAIILEGDFCYIFQTFQRDPLWIARFQQKDWKGKRKCREAMPLFSKQKQTISYS